MRKMIYNEIKELQNQQKLRLKPTKKKSIMDFIVSILGMIAKDVNRDNIIYSVLGNGILDSKQYQHPHFDIMLATCRRDPTKDKYKLYVNSSPIIINKYLEYGHVEGKLFKRLDIPVNRDVDGTKVSYIMLVLLFCIIIIIYKKD